MTTNSQTKLRVSVYEDSSFVVLANVKGSDGDSVAQADVSTIVVSGGDLSGATPNTATYTASLTVSDVVFNAMQTDSRWSVDSVGYNFAHTVPSTFAATGGHVYWLEYKFTATDSTVFVLPVEVSCIPVRAS